MEANGAPIEYGDAMKRSTVFGLGFVGLGLLMLAPIVLFVGIWQFLEPARVPVTQVVYSEFLTLAHADPDREPHVETVLFKGREIVFVVADPQKGTKAKRATIGPESTAEVARELTDRRIAVAFEQPPSPPMLNALLGVVFLGILGGGMIVYLGFELSHARKDLAEATAEARRLQALLDNAAQAGTAAP